MKIVGGIGKSGLGYVSAVLVSSKFEINAPVRFYIDTGASLTTIADRDAQRLGMKYDKMKKAPYEVSGVGGTVDAYLLPRCMLIFRFSDSVYAEYLGRILVLNHNPKTKKERERALEVPNLLGLDVLKAYATPILDTRQRDGVGKGGYS